MSNIIPATHSKITLKRPLQDKIQWILTDHHKKKQCYGIAFEESIEMDQPRSTIDIATRFLKLLASASIDQKSIETIVFDITRLYNNVLFSSSEFIQYILDHSLNKSRVLEVYYLVSTRLEVLALTLQLLLSYMPNIDEPLCELISYEEEIGSKYISVLDDGTLKKYFLQDGAQFVDMSASLKSNCAKRLLYILKHYANRATGDDTQQLFTQFVNMGNVTTSNIYKFLAKSKDIAMLPKKRLTTKQYDGLLLKIPIFQFLGSLFFEFNGTNIQLKLTDFLFHVFYLSSIKQGTEKEIPDVSFLLHVIHHSSRQLVVQGKSVVRIQDIISSLNDAVLKSLEQESAGEMLAVILTCAQLIFEQMQESVGYTYAYWFDATFVNQKTSNLNKRMDIIFGKILIEMIPYEIPGVLQIHGKVLSQSTSGHHDTYVPAVRKRLLELGMDSSLKSYPNNITNPIQSKGPPLVGDEVSEAIQQFIKKGYVIPTSLLQSHVFRRQWFVATFLPELINWKGRDLDAKNKLIVALKEKNKIPEAIYKEFIEKNKI